MKISPKISVIMPAYNAEEYIAEAIESILDQSFKDFEFIIIDDGSTDNSVQILDRYARKDPRIKIFRQDNRGVGASLNKGVSLARGKYIARMDADDISLPERLEKEYLYLEKHPRCAIVASIVQPIDENGNFNDFWPPDAETITYEQIKTRLPIENCVAHPSIMIRSGIMKKFGYIESQVPSEDYDLWLRLTAAGHQIHKLDTPLLLYRIHGASITQSYNQQFSINRKMLKVKSRFLKGQLAKGRFGPIERKVFISFSRLFLYLSFHKGENILWKVFVAPFKPFIHMYSAPLQKVHRGIYLLRLMMNRLSLYRNLGTKRGDLARSAVLFIVPWFGIGGAEKVLLDIITGLDKKGYRIFCISTVNSTNHWLERYAKHCVDVIDLDSISMESNKAWFLKKYALKNRVDAVVTTNNYPGYRAASLIKASRPDIKLFDIVHGQGGEKEGGGWPLFSTPYDKFLDKRVVVTEYLKKYLVQKHGIDSSKVAVIHNGIATYQGSIPPPAIEIKAAKGKFIVLWAGRFSYEKHPELAIKTAEIVRKKSDSVHFVIVGGGEMEAKLNEMASGLNIQDSVTLAKEPYTDPRSYMCYADVLLMSSEMEGLPMVILEAFAAKLPVIAPEVGGIPELVRDSRNGFLIEYSTSFPEDAAGKIIRLSTSKRLSAELGESGYKTMMAGYSYNKMIDGYVKVLEG